MMKLINGFYLAVALLVGAGAWKVLEPMVAKNNGNTVISINQGSKRGDGAITVKLPSDLTTKQMEMLNFAYDVAKADGFKEPKYLQGIIMQESRAGSMDEFRVSGLMNTSSNRYFGIGQIKLSAAKDVMKRFPELWKFLDTKTDEELQARLIVDDRFNVRVASKYTLLMGINENPVRAITAYNVGPGAVITHPDPSSHHYTVKVRSHAEKVKNVKTSAVGLQSIQSTKVAALDSRR